MAVRGSSNYYHLYRVQRRHWINHGKLTGLSQQQVESMMENIISGTPRVIERVSALLPDYFPSELAESVFSGMQKQCENLT